MGENIDKDGHKATTIDNDGKKPPTIANDGQRTPGETTHKDLESLAQAYSTMKHLFSENAELQGEREGLEREATAARRENEMVRSENEMLRGEMRKIKSERDHFNRAYSALATELGTIGNNLLNAVSRARANAYGERAAQSGDRKAASGEAEAEETIPRFLSEPAQKNKQERSPDQKSAAGAEGIGGKLAGIFGAPR
jgi:chromosome segregation ATPase